MVNNFYTILMISKKKMLSEFCRWEFNSSTTIRPLQSDSMGAASFTPHSGNTHLGTAHFIKKVLFH